MADNNDATDDIRPMVAEAIESISSNKSKHISIYGQGNASTPLNETEMVAIAEAISHSAHVKDLYLCGSLEVSPTPATATFLWKIFETHPSIKFIDLSENGLGDNLAEVIGNALKSNTSVLQIDLGENDIGPRGAEALAEGLRENKTLQEIHLSDNELGDRGAIALAKGLRDNNTLQTICFYKNNIGPRGAEALAEGLHENNVLRKINLNHNSIGCRGATALAESLQINTTLQAIRLYCNSIGYRGAEALAECLQVNTTLRTIYISGNSIGDRGVAALAVALRVNKTLVSLSVGSCGLTANEAKALASALEKSSLKDLDLCNDNLQDDGGKALANSLCKNTALTKLDLRNTGIGDETCKALAVALCNNSSLTKLDLCENKSITTVGAAAIENSLRYLNYSVEYISLYKINISDDQAGRIHDLCAQNVRVKAFFQQVTQNNPATIPLVLWPTVLETVKRKPDLLYALLKTKPEVCRELPRNQRRRKHPG